MPLGAGRGLTSRLCSSRCAAAQWPQATLLCRRGSCLTANTNADSKPQQKGDAAKCHLGRGGTQVRGEKTPLETCQENCQQTALPRHCQPASTIGTLRLTSQKHFCSRTYVRLRFQLIYELLRLVLKSGFQWSLKAL